MESKARALWNRLLGDRGERAAMRFLKQQGIRVILRGFRTSAGEVDLIARDGDTLAFIEVKTRSRGAPVEAVTTEKQRRVCRTAMQFVKRERLTGVRCRFDVVAVVWPDEGSQPRIEYIRAAFDFSCFD